MNKAAVPTQMVRILDLIDSNAHNDPSVRAHTRARNAVATDNDRLEAARLAALRLTYRLNVGAVEGWVHYCDSVGGIHGESL
jgi:hypothetical protein